MAKKRKSRTSEPQQPPPEQPQPQAEPETEIEQPNSVPDEYEVVEEEVEEQDNTNEEENDVEENDVEEAEEDDDIEVEEETEADAEAEAKVNGENEESEDEPIEKLLEPFTKDQLAALLKEAVLKHPDFIQNVKKLADLDPFHRKIFVHGLGWDTTSETLINVFGKYGEIEDCKAVSDKVTGKSKGYAFILFKHRVGAKKALVEPQKKIGNRVTSCQLASAGPVPAPPPNAPPVSEYTQRKIFVSNVGADIDVQKLLEFFSRFGEIEEGPLGLDKQTGKPKGFCLFVYRTAEGARKALEEPHKNFEGHTLNCQKAVDGPKQGKGGGGAGGGFYQQHNHHHSQQSYHGHTAKKGRYSGGSSSVGTVSPGGHLMAPGGLGFNPGVSPGALTPAIGQALALLATQGAGLGFGNLLGGMGASASQSLGVTPTAYVGQDAGAGGYGGPGAGGYGGQGAGAGGYGGQGAGAGVYGQPGMQGTYPNAQMGQGGLRPNQGGYMGHGN